MAKPGIYTDVNSLEQLNLRMGLSGEEMANIDTGVINYFNEVSTTLGRKLHYIQTKLEEAEARLSEAENAMYCCHARQHRDNDGNLVPSCSREESAVAAAQNVVDKWRSKYERALQICDECYHEIDNYYANGHQLILNMCNQQTPKITQLLRDCIEKLQEISNIKITI